MFVGTALNQSVTFLTLIYRWSCKCQSENKWVEIIVTENITLICSVWLNLTLFPRRSKRPQTLSGCMKSMKSSGVGCDLATWVQTVLCSFRVSSRILLYFPVLISPSPSQAFLLPHDSVITSLCSTCSVLVRKLDFDVIPPLSLLSLPHAFGQLQA